jgi:hypothetical protein|tara:strand:+ start:507 stop:2585 length:2079 start_codon:yes stop_codon:yes gene_type:complete
MNVKEGLRFTGSDLFTSVSIAAVLFFLLSSSMVSGVTDSLMRDSSLLGGGSRYTITQDALSTISEDNMISVIGTGSSQMFKALDGGCVSGNLENEALVYNIAQPSSGSYTNMLHIPRIINSNPEVVLIEIAPNSLGNISKSAEEYIELRFKLDTMNQDSTDLGGWVELIDPNHREWIALTQIERMEFKQEYVPSAIEERLNRLIFDEKTLGEIRTDTQKYGWVPETDSELWNGYLQTPIFPPDRYGFDGKTSEERENYNATLMSKTGNYKPAYRDSQSHTSLNYEISALLENGIRVIIVSPPHHPSALTYLEDGQWDGLNETLARYAEWPGVTVFDQTWETGWEDNHFYDRNHLDDEGRIEFCHRIAPIIDGVLDSIAAPKLLVITVDVEAGLKYTDDNHVERLIYGKFGSESAGISEIMDIADEVGVKISFFVDVMAINAYGEEIIDVLKDIDSRGHDVQLHMHPTMINSTTWLEIKETSEWIESGATQEVKMNCWTQETANYWFSKAMELFDLVGIDRPIAYRGGAYRYCDTTLQSMELFGMTQSYNYNIFSDNQNFSTEQRYNFQWENGIMELPISYVDSANGELVISSRIDESTWELPINSTFERFYDGNATTRVMTMILHSFSFLDWNDSGQKHLKDYSKLDSFRTFMHALPAEYRIVSATELQQYIDSGIIIGEETLPLELINNEC